MLKWLPRHSDSNKLLHLIWKNLLPSKYLKTVKRRRRLSNFGWSRCQSTRCVVLIPCGIVLHSWYEFPRLCNSLATTKFWTGAWKFQNYVLWLLGTGVLTGTFFIYWGFHLLISRIGGKSAQRWRWGVTILFWTCDGVGAAAAAATPPPVAARALLPPCPPRQLSPCKRRR